MRRLEASKWSAISCWGSRRLASLSISFHCCASSCCKSNANMRAKYSLLHTFGLCIRKYWACNNTRGLWWWLYLFSKPINSCNSNDWTGNNSGTTTTLKLHLFSLIERNVLQRGHLASIFHTHMWIQSKSDGSWLQCVDSEKVWRRYWLAVMEVKESGIINSLQAIFERDELIRVAFDIIWRMDGSCEYIWVVSREWKCVSAISAPSKTLLERHKTVSWLPSSSASDWW